ncbi:hypothetical protein L202_04456 [Cryptococcus amylolentus CBS 6039]|uniref:Uncharacterized protein n=2 Tax=Cryptococcus amylolentus TaxID=104669 RepID=A0A1E3HRH8_9TREE|nr:hypothetical protein L202_04456 [Cryptococcus amylolentus CBS 6039]ODN78937.1 hypothetical protein L202_04456 [Cryptococcus amylolentus CBS 6039]
MKRLLEVLEEIERGDVRDPTPERSREGVSQSSERSSKSVGLVESALGSCADALDSAQECLQSPIGQAHADTLGKITALLEAQRDEIEEMRVFIEARRFPSLVTLQQIYGKINDQIKGVSSLPDGEAQDALSSMVQVLQEGPDYLIDICLISAIVWYAEIIDSSYAASLRQILETAIASQSNLETFRQAAEEILGVSAGLDVGVLDDREAEDAYRDIGALLRQLQVRIESSTLETPSGSSVASTSTPTPLTLPGTPVATPPISPVSSTPSSSAGDADFKSMSVKDLQDNFGTGVTTPTPALPGLSSYNAPSSGPTAKPTPTPSSPASATGSEESQEIWEYRGQLLTRSALDLVLRQEMLEQADSSGQYAGEVSWDDLRGAWIPKWAKKLKRSDLAEGEVPDSNPATFEEKEEDEWGNEIGFYGVNKELYYKKEPTFDLKD